ncbi:MAG: hypothetical protein R2822_18650 [Spirosomataceae bacterium]
MKNYNDYKPEDFLNDEHFRKWISSEESEDSLLWENFKEQFPANINNFILAKALFKSLQQLQVPANKNIKNEIWTQVEDVIDESSLEDEQVRSPWTLYRGG